MSTPLFPEYFDQGTEGYPVAVNVLGFTLKLLRFETPGRPIIYDGVFKVEGNIADALGNLQVALGLERDCNFGPKTRRRLLEEYGIDVNDLTVERFTMPRPPRRSGPISQHD